MKWQGGGNEVGGRGWSGCGCTAWLESSLPLSVPLFPPSAPPAQSGVHQKERQRLISAGNTKGTEYEPETLHLKIKQRLNQSTPFHCLALFSLTSPIHTLGAYPFIIHITDLPTDTLQCRSNTSILDKEVGLHFIIVKLQRKG